MPSHKKRKTTLPEHMQVAPFAERCYPPGYMYVQPGQQQPPGMQLYHQAPQFSGQFSPGVPGSSSRGHPGSDVTPSEGGDDDDDDEEYDESNLGSDDDSSSSAKKRKTKKKGKKKKKKPKKGKAKDKRKKGAKDESDSESTDAKSSNELDKKKVPKVHLATNKTKGGKVNVLCRRDQLRFLKATEPAKFVDGVKEQLSDQQEGAAARGAE
ncbi:unnamed protein product [Effrenium voratum]|uniref:Uncharacterized protein n=1 Tax=Effrenium voratum TaxID=2562239 RepID=A0AA36ITF8_9DINO|nr:unnamed protein product [Effrenium voratum]